MGWIADLI